jgi:hypothetical protein
VYRVEPEASIGELFSVECNAESASSRFPSSQANQRLWVSTPTSTAATAHNTAANHATRTRAQKHDERLDDCD